MLNLEKTDTFYVSDKLVIARLSPTIWLCLKAREISRQNMRNLEIISHIVLGTVP